MKIMSFYLMSFLWLVSCSTQSAITSVEGESELYCGKHGTLLHEYRWEITDRGKYKSCNISNDVIDSHIKTISKTLLYIPDVDRVFYENKLLDILNTREYEDKLLHILNGELEDCGVRVAVITTTFLH